VAATLQSLSGNERVNIFGVRHLSPASAHNMLAYLNEIRPKCVLIEGACDCSDLLPYVAKKQVQPPIAILAYTTQLPIRTLLYPFASYSPEYQAVKWALANKAQARFIDLPTTALIGQGQPPEPTEADEQNEYYKTQSRIYADMVNTSGEYDYETFWERNFEHCLQLGAFTEKIAAFSELMRTGLEELQWETEKRAAVYNYVREAHMKREIAKAIKQEGYKPGKIVVVTGAYHVKGLYDEAVTPMTDEEYKKLPYEETRLTLMPYSYYRLSSKSGYGAGNKAPAYFKLMWECLQQGDLAGLAPLYLAQIGGLLREAGNYNSTASVIEGVRLAKSLAYMHEGLYPTLKDLHDAAVCLLGEGELSTISEAIARVDVGTEIGYLPEGVSQTPVQDDMARQLKRLKLEPYKSVVARDIELDLRENRKVKSAEAAFIDLNRSVFFNRLLLLDISFAVYKGTGSSAWSEKWVLVWTPETEIELVEATLKGETVENAAAFVLKERFEAANSILEIAKLLHTAFICRLLSEVPGGIMRLQTLCVDSVNFAETAGTALELSNTIRYRDVRNVDTTPLIPALQQVFLRAALVMSGSALCNDEAANQFITGLGYMHTVSQEQFEHIDDELWLNKLHDLADSDSCNAKISGAATAVLMERNEISDEDLQISVARRLSYGVPGDLAGMWFEGLSARNRYVLLSRANLWRQLDDYLKMLDENEFRRALVFLRRAFSSFEPEEKNSIIDILADLWQVNAMAIGEFLQEDLSEAEQDELDALNDFDFDF